MEETKKIKLNELFIVDGKQYMVTLPTMPRHLEMANGHGHIVICLQPIN